MSRGFLLVSSGPGGSGKDTASAVLMKKNKGIKYSASVTARTPRSGEVNDKNYFFATMEESEKMVENGELLEHAHIYTNYYGTPKGFVFNQIDQGEIVLLGIDVQGALQVKSKYRGAIFIFLLLLSMDGLLDRVHKRGTGIGEDIETRFSNTFKELGFVGEYDYFVVNDSMDQATKDIESIIAAEKLKVKRHSNIKRIMMKGRKDSFEYSKF